MSGAIPTLPQYVFMGRCLVKAQGQLYLYLYKFMYLLFCYLTSWGRFRLEKLIVAEWPNNCILLWNTEVHYRVNKSTSFGPFLSHMNLSYPISQRSILISSLLCLFLWGFLTNILCVFLISAVCSTCPTHHIPLHLITLWIFKRRIRIVKFLLL
jgi:hypothetical protein